MKYNYWKLVIFVVILSNLMNIGNYSFFTYTFSGAKFMPIIGDLIASLRLPLSLIPLLVFGQLDEKIKRKVYFFFSKNLDVVLFALLPFLSLVNSESKLNGSFYTIWHVANMFNIMILLWYAARNKERLHSLFIILKILFIGNIIVLPLLMLNIGDAFRGGVYNMAFSSKLFYPYSLLVILISSLLLLYIKSRRLEYLRSEKLFLYSKYFYIIVILLSVFFLLIGGRRTPLVVAFILGFGYLYLRYGDSIIKRILASISISILIGAFAISIPILLNKYGDKLYTLNRLTQIEGISLSGGIKESKHHESYAERLIIWNSYLTIYNEYPLLGVGLFNGTVHHISKYDDWRLAGYSTHNTYLSVLVEQGIIGFCLFLLIIFRGVTLIFLYAERNVRLSYLLLLFSVLIINWNEFNSLGGQIFFWPSFIVILFPRIFLKKS